jgi:hypothetical protein
MAISAHIDPTQFTALRALFNEAYRDDADKVWDAYMKAHNEQRVKPAKPDENDLAWALHNKDKG